MTSAGYYVIDFSDYGTGNSGTLRYNVKSICRLYGIDSATLSADDFVVGINGSTGEGSSRGETYSHTNYGANTLPISKSYDAENGVLTLSNLKLSLEGQYSTGYYTTNQVICYLIPSSVIVN